MAKKTDEIDVLAAATEARRAKKAAQNAAARRRAAANNASGVGRQHTQLGVNDGIKARSKRDRDRQEALAVNRKDQRDKAATMVAQLLPDEGAARKAFTAVLAEFLTAEAKNVNGQRVGATEVAANKVRVKYAQLLRDDPTEFNAGVKAAKMALWRAATPDWEKVEARDRAASRRSQNRRKPAVTPKKAAAPSSPEQIKKLRDAVAAAQLDANLAKAALPVNGKRMSSKVADDRLAAAKKALASATAA